MADVTLTENEREAMSAYASQEKNHGFGFRGVAANCDLPRHLIRRTVRACARKGLLRFHRALWNEDGQPAGAGYVLTQAGRGWLDRHAAAEQGEAERA